MDKSLQDTQVMPKLQIPSTPAIIDISQEEKDDEKVRLVELQMRVKCKVDITTDNRGDMTLSLGIEIAPKTEKQREFLDNMLKIKGWGSPVECVRNLISPDIVTFKVGARLPRKK